MSTEKQKEASKKYYAKNKNKWAERYNANRQRHNELCRESYNRNKELNDLKKKRWIEKNFEYALWSSAKTRAARSQIEFTLTREDIVIPKLCPYLEEPLTKIQGQGRVWSNASIDRKDNLKGYTPENIEIISCLANTMKNCASPEQLKKFAVNVLGRLSSSKPNLQNLSGDSLDIFITRYD